MARSAPASGARRPAASVGPSGAAGGLVVSGDNARNLHRRSAFPTHREFVNRDMKRFSQARTATCLRSGARLGEQSAGTNEDELGEVEQALPRGRRRERLQRGGGPRGVAAG